MFLFLNSDAVLTKYFLSSPYVTNTVFISCYSLFQISELLNTVMIWCSFFRLFLYIFMNVIIN